MINNEIYYQWKNHGKWYEEKKLDRSAVLMLMRSIVLNYTMNNSIATRLSELLPTTKKIVVDNDRAQENPEGAFIICVLEDGTEEIVKASLTNYLMWDAFRRWGEG